MKQQTCFTDGSDRCQHHDDAGRHDGFDNRQQRADRSGFRERQAGEGDDADTEEVVFKLNVVAVPADEAELRQHNTLPCKVCGKILGRPYIVNGKYSLCTEACYEDATAIPISADQPMPYPDQRLIRISDEKRIRAEQRHNRFEQARQRDDKLRARLGLPFLDGESRPEATSQSPELMAA